MRSSHKSQPILVYKLGTPCTRVNMLDCGLGMLLNVLYTCRHWGKLATATRADVVLPRDVISRARLLAASSALSRHNLHTCMCCRRGPACARTTMLALRRSSSLPLTCLVNERACIAGPPVLRVCRLQMRRRNTSSSDLTRDLQLCLRARIRRLLRRVTMMRPE